MTIWNTKLSGPGVGPTTSGPTYMSGWYRGATSPVVGTVVAQDIKKTNAASTTYTEGESTCALSNFVVPDATNKYAGEASYPGSPIMLLGVNPAGFTIDAKFNGLLRGRANAVVNAAGGGTFTIAAGDYLCADNSASATGRLYKFNATAKAVLGKPIAIALAAASTDGATIEVIFDGEGIAPGGNLALT